jgi:Acetyltransferase (GNAT) domain
MADVWRTIGFNGNGFSRRLNAQLYIATTFQRRGFGTQLLKRLFVEASESKLPIRLRVLAVNPARAFYERLWWRRHRSAFLWSGCLDSLMRQLSPVDTALGAGFDSHPSPGRTDHEITLLDIGFGSWGST